MVAPPFTCCFVVLNRKEWVLQPPRCFRYRVIRPSAQTVLIGSLLIEKRDTSSYLPCGCLDLLLTPKFCLLLITLNRMREYSSKPNYVAGSSRPIFGWRRVSRWTCSTTVPSTRRAINPCRDQQSQVTVRIMELSMVVAEMPGCRRTARRTWCLTKD